jgi:hypothetical protein
MTRKLLGLLMLGQAMMLGPRVARAQELQLHYDFRHSVDPRNNPRDFPAVTFKSFKALEFGSFLLKMEANLDGTRHDMSKGYLEITQTLRFWKAPVYAHVEYSGGLGTFDGATGGYYVDNAYMLGAAYPFQWQGGWANAYVAYKHTNFAAPSHDPQASLYWGRGFRKRWSFASTAVTWTQNRNHGDDYTANLEGKQWAFLIENELWWRATGPLSIGSEVRVSRHVYTSSTPPLVYPTLGVRYLF